MVPPSQSEKLCWKCEEALASSPFCPKCGVIQDVPPGLSHFDVLGIPVSLRVDADALREAFYDLSRRVHPDKFGNAPAPQPSYALRWSTAVNRAYQTLREPAARANYLLELAGVPAPASAQVPLELAEAYFDLQDLLSESQGAEKLLAFRTDLDKQLAASDAEWNQLADTWNQSSEQLQALQRLLALQRYLRSMIADLERKGSHGHRGD